MPGSIILTVTIEDSITHFGADHEYTKLIPTLKGVDPDDAFSTVPYEKGFHFLYYLEKLVGRDNFDKFIPHYFTKFSGKSLDSFEFKEIFISFFDSLGDEEIKKKVAEIDWEGRFYNPGLPPKPDFDTSYVDQCYSLAEKWKDSVSRSRRAPRSSFLFTPYANSRQSYTPSKSDVESFSANQKLVFLESIQKFDPPISSERAKLLGDAYDLLSSQNVELKAAYYHIAMGAKDTSSYEGVSDLLGRVGRMKFVRPLFRGLNKVDRELALKTFEKNKDFYHPICRGMVEKDLGLE